MEKFKFRRVAVDYCEIEAPDADSAWDVIYSGLADWGHDETIQIDEVEHAND